MGTLIFSEMKDFLQLRCRERTDITDIGGVDFSDKFINLAYTDLTTKNRILGMKRDFYFPELMASDTGNATTDGTPYINSASDVLYITDVYDETRNQYLEWIPWREYIKKTDRLDTGAEGPPTKWHRYGTPGTSDLYLYPTPDSDTYSISFYYRKRPAALSTDSDSHVLGPEWDEPIIDLAAIKAYTWLGFNVERIPLLKQEWVDKVTQILGVYDKEEMARSPQIRPPFNIKGHY